MPHAHSHILPGKPQSVTSQEHLNHFDDSGGGCLWALLLILRLSASLQHLFLQCLQLPFIFVQSAHQQLQTTEHKAVLAHLYPFSLFAFPMDFPFSFRLCSGFSCLSPSPHGFPLPCNAVFYLFFSLLSLPPSFISVPRFQLRMFKLCFSWQ